MQPGQKVSLSHHQPVPSVIYLLSHNLCFYFTSLPLSSKPPSPIPRLYSCQCVHLTKQVIRELPHTSPTKYQFLLPNLQLTCTSPHSLYLPSYCDGWTAFSPCPHSLSLLVTWGVSCPIWLPHDSRKQWFVFTIFAFYLLGHLHEHTVSLKQNNQEKKLL